MAANRSRVAEYLWRESGKWSQKQAPEGFGSMKFYGRWGQKQGFNPRLTEKQMNERAAMELRRVLRRMVQQRNRALATRYGRRADPRAGMPRGRDGLTVFDVDGAVWGPRLEAWANEVAADKAAAEGDVERDVYWRGWHSLRAFPELRIVEIDDGRPPDDFDDDDPRADPHFGMSQRDIDLIEYEEAMAERAEEQARVDEEIRQHQERERRKAELQRRDRERQARRAAGRDGSGERP